VKAAKVAAARSATAAGQRGAICPHIGHVFARILGKSSVAGELHAGQGLSFSVLLLWELVGGVSLMAQTLAAAPAMVPQAEARASGSSGLS
jgi:hypothetical protein